MGCSFSKPAEAPRAVPDRAPSPARKVALQTASALLEKYDRNGDGELQVSELQELIDELGVPDVRAEDLMRELDINQSGTLGVNEVLSFIRIWSPAASEGGFERRSALVVIDVQNDFISGTLANPHDATTIVPVINDLRSAFDAVVISYDWHPQEHCSFVESAQAGHVPIAEDASACAPFTQVTLLADAERGESKQVLYPRHCVQGSVGAEPHADLIVKDSDPKVFKGTRANIDSYSAFYDNNKGNDTGLTAMLTEHGITDVYCCGLVTDICVKSTALHGAEGGFHVAIIEDASMPFVKENMGKVREQLAEAGVELVTAAQAKSQLAGLKGTASLKAYLQSIRRSKGAAKVHKMHKAASEESLSSSHPRPP